jgi:hypothetical protein
MLTPGPYCLSVQPEDLAKARRALLPGQAAPAVSTTPVNTHRVCFTYPGKADVALVHVLEVGDGVTAGPPARTAAGRAGQDIRVTVEGRTFVFAGAPPYAVE